MSFTSATPYRFTLMIGSQSSVHDDSVDDSVHDDSIQNQPLPSPRDGFEEMSRSKDGLESNLRMNLLVSCAIAPHFYRDTGLSSIS